MKDNYILTAESVTAGHPDKLCDTIADRILDTCLKEDPNARVACEVLATAGKILVAGELRTTASPDVETIVRQTVRNAGYPSGRFVLGGFEADTGLTGRKLMVDTYGGLVPHGGGALSGKDGTKVDRNGAYMARYVAKNIVAAGLADACTVSLAYAIGQTEPVAAEIDTQESGYYDDAFLTEAVRRVFDFTPAGMIHALDLDKPFFAEVCNNCHFMHPQAAWEQTDKTEKLRMACAELEDERGQN